MLAEVIGSTQYTAKTTKVYTVPVEPAAYDARITTNTEDLNRRKWMAENNQKIESWALMLGARNGVKDNFKDALDLMFYDQLQDEVLGYTQVSIIYFLDHLKTWCRVNATIRKMMKD